MRHRFHAICPYFAMFPESFVAQHLAWTEPGDLVLDPFSGRGTTVLEALLSGRRAIGGDTNPVAVCISNAKAAPPTYQDAIDRLRELKRDFAPLHGEELQSEFFTGCFHQDTLAQVLYLRAALDWAGAAEDRFIAAVALGCLHGESHRSSRYFSNRMPRTISTKPAYSVRWWAERNMVPPRRDVFEIIEEQIGYRMASDPPAQKGWVAHADARVLFEAFPDHVGGVELVVTSPPYLDTTNFAEDQWLRLWFLGGPPYPAPNLGPDDRYLTMEMYWSFLTESWTGIAELLSDTAQLVIRLGGRRLIGTEVEEDLRASLTAGLGREVRLVRETESAIRGSQRRVVMPTATGSEKELDFHYAVV